MNGSGSSRTQSLGEGHRYRLDERIATGGMGEVWRATDTVLGREVAVKVMKDEYADDPSFRSRFEAEARSAAALNHPGVASVFDFGDVPSSDESPDGERRPSTRPFLVMELVEGQPLSSLLRGNEPMPPTTAADLIAQSAEALATAHALGIVHRDVKPANLMVTPDGRVKITDFGIARAADGLALTGTGEVLGTPHYISPEQAEGKKATPASDIYALGVVLYECLAGRRPFAAVSPVATALAHLRDPVPPLPGEVPEPMRQITMRALEKDPADRFASAADLAGALRGAPIGTGTAGAVDEPATRILTPAAFPAGAVLAGASGSSPGGGDRPRSRRRRALAAYWPVAAAVAAVLLVIGFVSLSTGGTDGDTSDGSRPQQTPTGGQRDDRILVREAEYVGMETGVAKKRLEALGFKVDEERTDNPDGNPEGTVASLDPHGLLEPEREITLVAWDKAPPAEEPDEDSEDEGSGEESGDDKGNDKGAKSEGKPDNGESNGGKGKAEGRQSR